MKCVKHGSVYFKHRKCNDVRNTFDFHFLTVVYFIHRKYTGNRCDGKNDVRRCHSHSENFYQNYSKSTRFRAQYTSDFQTHTNLMRNRVVFE